MNHDIRRNNIGLPVEQGLYDPANEHDPIKDAGFEKPEGKKK